MKTIREIFIINLKALRKPLTQAQFAARAGIPYRAYQNAENGVFPQEKNMAKIAAAHGVPESRLFIDSDTLPIPTPEQALKVIADLVHSVKKS